MLNNENLPLIMHVITTHTFTGNFLNNTIFVLLLKMGQLFMCPNAPRFVDSLENCLRSLMFFLVKYFLRQYILEIIICL